VRCLKPNDQNVCDNLQPDRLLEQLRYSGVLEAVRVARAGFPQRYKHKGFIQRYSVLCPSAAFKIKDTKLAAEKLVEGFVKDQLLKLDNLNNKTNTKYGKEVLKKYGIRVGNTRVFLRKGAFEMLEFKRAVMLGKCALQLQRIARGFIEGNKFRNLKCAILRLQFRHRLRMRRRFKMIAAIQAKARQIVYQEAYARIKECILFQQSVVRGFLAKLECHRRRSHIAASTIQGRARVCIARQSFKDLKTSAIQIQAFRRGVVHTRNLKYFATTARVQARWRGVAQRKRHTIYVEWRKKAMVAAVLAQSRIRIFLARKRLEKLRALQNAPQPVHQGCSKRCVIS